IQHPRCGDGDVHSVTALQIPRAGQRLGGIPSRPGNQRPRRGAGYGTGAAGHSDGRALPLGTDPGNEGTDLAGQPQLSPADEAVACGQRRGDRYPGQKGCGEAFEVSTASAAKGTDPAPVTCEIQR